MLVDKVLTSGPMSSSSDISKSSVYERSESMMSSTPLNPWFRSSGSRMGLPCPLRPADLARVGLRGMGEAGTTPLDFFGSYSGDQSRRTAASENR